MENQAKDVTIEMDDRLFQLTLSMKDESLIERILNALSREVQSGSSLRIRHVQKGALSSTQHMIMKIISHPRQLASWKTEVKTLMSVAGSKKR